MEEILASIRKIIAEDQPESAAAAPEASVAQPAPVEDSRPVELRNFIESPEFEETPEPVTEEPMGHAARSLDAFASTVEDEVFESDRSFAPGSDVLPEDYGAEANMDDDLISASTRQALDRAFEDFEERSPITAAAPPTGASIEAVFTQAIQEAFEPSLQAWIDDHGTEIVDRLGPLIREWMDDNLPPLIEAAVRKEIARAVRSRRR
jgi:hypothetical protein